MEVDSNTSGALFLVSAGIVLILINNLIIICFYGIRWFLKFSLKYCLMADLFNG
jgi:hypothetical protein